MALQIQYPYKRENGTEDFRLVKHYSDNEMLIHKVGTNEFYSAAVDIYPCPYEYEETDKPIEEK